MGTAGATTVTVCAQCGRRIGAEADRCAACGHLVDRSALPSQTARRRHSAVVDQDGTVPVLPGAVAPLGRRVVALLLDQLAGGLLVVLAVVVWLGAGLPTGPVLLAAVVALSALVLAAQLVAEAVTGATLGGAVLGIRTVGARTGLPAGLLAILLRDLVLTAGALFAGVGAYVVAGSGVWDPSPARRGWHDTVAGTIVLHAWAVPGREDRRAAADRRARGAGPLPAPLTATGAVPPSPPVDRAAARVSSAPTQVLAAVPPDRSPSDPVPSAHPAADTTQSDPAPCDPTPSDLTPSDPTPSGPTPSSPTPSGPTPSAPTPSDPAPSDPAPSPATHATRTPTAPTPVAAPGEPSAPAAGARLPAELELTRLAADRPVELLPQAWLRLEFDTGEVVDVVGDGAVGRDPAHTSGHGAHHQVALQDPDRALSRLHLLFGPEQGGALLWVSDPGSTNGTVLQDPTGAVAVLAPGVRAVIGAGWQLRLGDRTVRVSAIV